VVRSSMALLRILPDDDGANFHGQKRKNDTHASTTD
jgi:hypothetical protein